ncbi:MAG: helix-turn-helix domain-containing protein [Crocinitomicaceae bacterium]
MIRLQHKYEQAVQFRKRGFTYSEIAKIVDVSVSTVSAWLSKQGFSKLIKKDNVARAAKDNSKRMKMLNKARLNQYTRLYLEAERSAVLEYRHFKKDPLFIAGVMLYIGEGDNSTNRLVRIANARKDVHRIFMKFAVEYLGIERSKIRFWILLYPDLNEDVCIRAWSKSLGLTQKNFYKNQIIQGKSKKRTLQHGVGNTIIGSAVLKRKLMKWIELASKEY